MKLVKICGLQTMEAAEVAALNGVDLLGCILVPNRQRTVDPTVARQISQIANFNRPKTVKDIFLDIKSQNISDPIKYFDYIKQEILSYGPYLVGVFRNQSEEEVFKQASDLNLDFVQLHGDENKTEFIRLATELGFGVIPRYVIPRDIEQLKKDTQEIVKLGALSIPLLDSDQGGEGKVGDWDYITENLGFTSALLAGGLTPENLIDTKNVKNIIGYDVSGGVETDGKKDPTKIIRFIVNGKAV
ncbi:bifunctional tryptophan synthase trp1 [Lodderomyces elongisporus]|nr:bifunctional tryptophan synthase trp1 [Lodderomyces elongisporus]WLF77702.1 bifunctional tryptophan synthase trp1 [Lodderomyces elongisporus]